MFCNTFVFEVPAIKTVCVDLEDWDATRQAIQTLPPIDILVNNAGIAVLTPFLHIQPAEFDK